MTAPASTDSGAATLPETAKALTQGERTAAFRKKWRRIDYYPTTKAHDAILRRHAQYPRDSIRKIIDDLILAGEKAVSGNK